MKRIYETPEIEITRFSTESIMESGGSTVSEPEEELPVAASDEDAKISYFALFR